MTDWEANNTWGYWMDGKKERPIGRIRFTRDELEVIADMCAIASAAAWGDGDYMDWDEKRSKPFDSLREKVTKLISRADGGGQVQK